MCFPLPKLEAVVGKRVQLVAFPFVYDCLLPVYSKMNCYCSDY
jgi:hypothetical protein